MPKGPLAGIRVVEIGTAIAGPLSCALLGDMGADVVKVEPPGKGDDSRRWGKLVRGESPYFIQYNRNKRSVTLNLRSEEGKQILAKLLSTADVFVENLRPGTMGRLGFGYDRVRKLNPKIIYCSVSGFGQDGPYAGMGGYDAVVQAMSGVMSVTGYENGPPLRAGFPVTDILAAVNASLSIALALFARERTGEGQEIDVSLFESGVFAVAQWATIHALTGEPVRRFGNAYPLLAPYELFDAKDRPFIVAVGNDELWAKLCRAMKKEELINDARFSANSNRIEPENRKALRNVLSAAFKRKSASEWTKLLAGAGIPVALISGVEELASDPQLRARGAFSKVRHSRLGTIQVVSTMPKLSKSPGRVRRASPLLGEHSDQILEGLGYSKSQVRELKSRAIV